MTEFNYLVPPKIVEQMTAIFAQYLITQASGINISAQQTLDLPLVPAAALGQAQFIAELELFSRNQERGQLALYSEVGEVFESLSVFVPELIARIDTSGTDATYQNGIDYIAATFNDVKTKLDLHRSSFASFLDALAVVQGTYDLAQKQSAEKLSGEDGEIDTLREKIKSLTAGLDEVNGKIAMGATMKAVKDVELGLEAASAIVELPGIGDLVMDTTFDYVNEAIGDDGDSLAESDKLLKEYSEALLELEGDIAQVAVIAALKANGDRFVTAITQTKSILSQVSDEMSSLVEALQGFKAIDDTAEVTRQLSDGLSFWSLQSQTANALLQAARNIDPVPKSKRYV